MKKLSKQEVAALFPRGWELPAATEEDIIFFGRVTILEMIHMWRRTAIHNLNIQIDDRDVKLSFFERKRASNIRAIAKKYDSPEFHYTGAVNDSLGYEPRRTKYQRMLDWCLRRKKDRPIVTTFNFCGWCKHAGHGLRSHNYCGIKEAAGIKDEKRTFNTPCFFKKAPDKVFDNIRKGLILERKRLSEEKQKIEDKINILLSLSEQAEEKPAFPLYRQKDWFKAGDPVVSCIVYKDDFLMHAVLFYEAWVDKDHCDKSCVIPVRYKSNNAPKKKDVYGDWRAEIMLVWEFEYLLEHPDFAKIWATKGTRKHSSETNKNFNAELFLEALHKIACRKLEEEAKTS